MKWMKMQTVVKLRNGPVKFSCLIASGELLPQGLEKKKKMRVLERESWGGIERGSGLGKGRKSMTLRAGSCGEREKSVGSGRTMKEGALLLTLR